MLAAREVCCFSCEVGEAENVTNVRDLWTVDMVPYIVFHSGCRHHSFSIRPWYVVGLEEPRHQ